MMIKCLGGYDFHLANSYPNMLGLEIKNYLADSPPAIVRLEIKKHFDALEDKQKRYAHFISRWECVFPRNGGI